MLEICRDKIPAQPWLDHCRSSEGVKHFARNSERTVFFKNLLKRNARPPWKSDPISGSLFDFLKITPTALRVWPQGKLRKQKQSDLLGLFLNTVSKWALGCYRVFITQVKGTFFGMSESVEASKRRWNSCRSAILLSGGTKKEPIRTGRA
jgi:hypothetical protein